MFGLGLVAGVGLTGCQIDIGGQTLPSPYYMQDDVQYFPPGPEFKLSREAAAMKAYNQEQIAASGPTLAASHYIAERLPGAARLRGFAGSAALDSAGVAGGRRLALLASQAWSAVAGHPLDVSSARIFSLPMVCLSLPSRPSPNSGSTWC